MTIISSIYDDNEWQLVPKRETLLMRDVFSQVILQHVTTTDISQVWRAMLQASPTFKDSREFFRPNKPK